MTAMGNIAVNVINNAPKYVETFNTAIQAIQSGLHNVKVSKREADKMERELKGELFDKYVETCEVMKSTKIPCEDIRKYLDHMKNAYEGIDDTVRKKMEGVLFVEGTWEYKILEYKINVEGEAGAKYGLIAFGKSPCQKFYDCMFVLYHMNFKISTQMQIKSTEYSILWGIYKWITTNETKVSTRKFGTETNKVFQNFFRLKALQGFYKEGVIESINYVDSLEDIPA